MLFNSPLFLFLFLPACVAGFYGLGHLDRRAACVWLFAASLVFYGWWHPGSVACLLATAVFNYGFGRLIAASHDRPRRQSALLTVGIGADVALLAYCKYVFPLLHDLGLEPAAAAPDAGLLPLLGISFFTFTQIMYLLDCQQSARAERNIFDYALFVAFFPSLISGPILRHRDIAPQFNGPATGRLQAGNLAVGATMFVLGLGKKALLADPIAPFADAGYAHADRVQMIGAWGAALAFALQLYFDFSGYCDMAIGVARMFGIRLPQNFASPYKAASIIDYWQRWNITLTRFFTLYLYNPLALGVVRRQAANDATLLRAGAGGPGAFLAAVGLPTVATMALIGIWHGAGLQFLCFGLLHAAYIIVNHAWRRLRPKRPGGTVSAGIAPGPLRRAGAVLLTFLAVVVAQTFFRAASLPAALAMTEGLLGLRGLGWDAWLLPASDDVGGGAGWLQIALLLAIVWGLPNTQQITAAYAPTLDPVRRPASAPLDWRPSWPWAIGLGLILMFSIEGIGRSRSFLYFQF